MSSTQVGQMSNTAEEIGAVEDEQDPLTLERIRSFGLRPGSRCLDLGAGQGSVAAGLAELVGPASVTAVDRRPAGALLELGAAGVTVVAASVADWSPGSERFDLVHARALLTHLPDREQVLARMVSWLNPGGWLLVTDPADFPLASSPYPIMRRSAEVLSELAAMMGTDPSWARRYPAQLDELGLVQVDADCRLRMMRGGTREALMLSRLYARAREPMIQAGMTVTELDSIQSLLHSADYVDLPPAVIRAWGRRPTDRPS